MRVLLTAILWCVILGGTWAYVRIDDGFKREASEVDFAFAAGVTKVQIDRTFDCFADADFEEPAIKVTFGGDDVFPDKSNVIPADKSIEFELQDVEQLQNTVTVFANATSPESFGDDRPTMRAMVVRILHDDQTIAEKVFHADGSVPTIGGEVSFEIDIIEESAADQNR